MTRQLIPTGDDFTSATVVDRYDDMINPPGLTNHLAVVQVDHDVIAVRSLMFRRCRPAILDASAVALRP